MEEVATDGGNERLKVLRTDAHTPLRAGSAWIWSQAPAPKTEYFETLKKAGLNAIRVILFDVWLQNKGYATFSWNDPQYKRETLGKLDATVDAASRAGLYVIINAHNALPSADRPFQEATTNDLWDVIAPRYKNRTHVIYELSNEALAGAGRGMPTTEELNILESLSRLHAKVSRLAPSTHLMILTPAGVSGYGDPDAMIKLTAVYEKIHGPIDWSNTSVAYHLYHADAQLFPNAENLRRFHRKYPGWPSENNFPARFTSEMLGAQAGDNERSVSFGNDEFVMQTCERLGLGWAQWHIDGPVQFQRNWPILWRDARDKHYAWKPDP